MALFDMIFAATRPKVATTLKGIRLVALTPKMEAAFQGSECLIQSFPFRIGRESQSTNAHRERDRGNFLLENDLNIYERGPRLNISREHLEICQKADGSYELLDQQSACGTIVDGERLGGNDLGGRRILKHGDVIIIGSSRSPFVFRFEILENKQQHQLENAIAGLDYLREEGILSDDTYKDRVAPLKQKL